MPAKSPKFLTPLRIEKLDARRWVLTDHLVFESVRFPGRFIGPAGSQTDLASIPRIGQVVFPKVGKQDKGSVVHDLGYTHQLVTEHGERIHTVKHVADLLFLEGMQAEGVHWISARVMYGCVVAFGNPQKHPLAAHQLQPEQIVGHRFGHVFSGLAHDFLVGAADPFVVRGLDWDLGMTA